MPAFQENIKHMIRRSGGSTFWRKITVTSSKIKTATATDISAAATGDLAITAMFVKTDATGLAGGTNFQILTNNSKGLANVFVETVANLGANQTKMFPVGSANADTTTADGTPSVTSLPTILEAGKKLQVQNTSADGTGAGTIDIYIKFERVVENADVLMVGSVI